MTLLYCITIRPPAPPKSKVYRFRPLDLFLELAATAAAVCLPCGFPLPCLAFDEATLEAREGDAELALLLPPFLALTLSRGLF